MSLLEFASVYFSSLRVLFVLVILYAAIGALVIFFRANPERPAFRSRILLAIFALASSSWMFVGSSLLFCRVFESLYYYHQTAAITMVLGASLIATLIICLPVSLLMATKLPNLIVSRLERELLAPSESSSNLIEARAQSLASIL